MNSYFEDISDTRKKFTVEVSAQDIKDEEAKLIQQFAQQVRLPGFRPGKAPVDMVRKRYVKEIAEELKRKITSRCYEAAIKEHEVSVYGVVDVDDIDMSGESETTEVNFTVELQPQVPTPKYQGMELKVPPAEVTEEEVTKAREQLLEQRAEFKTVEKAAEKGDFVRLSYTGTIDGEPMPELEPGNPFGSQSATWEEAGSEQSPGVQAIVQALVGMSAGDTSTVEQAYEEDFEIEALQGKTVAYEVKVEEVRQKELPELDEELLKQYKVESVDELNTRIKENISQQKERRVGEIKRQQAVDIMLQQGDFNVPESAVEVERENILREYMQQQMSAGATMEQFEDQKDELLAGAQEAALKRVKGQFLLMDIAKKESIELTQQDMQQTLMQEAYVTRTKPEKLMKELKKDQDRLRDLQRQSLIHKALDFVVNQATVTEVEPQVEAGEAHSH